MLIKICKISEIKEGELKEFTSDNIDFLIAKIDNRFYGVVNICPHQTRKMMTPRLKNNILFCDHHAIGYDITTGEVVHDSGFYDVQPLREIKLIEQDDYILIKKIKK